jgi:hypothetical protein
MSKSDKKASLIFSCVGVPDRPEGKLVHIGKLTDEKIIRDSYICSCIFQATEIDGVGLMYACNIDDKYLLNENKSKSLPMLRILIYRQTKTSQHKLVDFSAWFNPNDSKDIKLIKEANSSKYNNIIMKGKFRFRAVTFNNGSDDVKDTIWFDGPKNGCTTSKDFFEVIRKHPKLLEIIDIEWNAVKQYIIESSGLVPDDSTLNVKDV